MLESMNSAEKNAMYQEWKKNSNLDYQANNMGSLMPSRQ